ncbi:MAG: hypothetical protein HYW45_01500 [Candidatus Daviesbacteria bacterium]|nr:MAG: hypothetical protein HYW45_01500 [Candidatus Daviesbacteria bacterium]
MDFLSIALILLIIVLGIFLSITGVQVFFILKDLKKALDRFNVVIGNEEVVEKVSKASLRVSKASLRVNQVQIKSGQIKKPPVLQKRFFKRS